MQRERESETERKTHRETQREKALSFHVKLQEMTKPILINIIKLSSAYIPQRMLNVNNACSSTDDLTDNLVFPLSYTASTVNVPHTLRETWPNVIDLS